MLLNKMTNYLLAHNTKKTIMFAVNGSLKCRLTISVTHEDLQIPQLTSDDLFLLSLYKTTPCALGPRTQQTGHGACISFYLWQCISPDLPFCHRLSIKEQTPRCMKTLLFTDVELADNPTRKVDQLAVRVPSPFCFHPSCQLLSFYHIPSQPNSET